jgi:predicted membrane protein
MYHPKSVPILDAALQIHRAFTLGCNNITLHKFFPFSFHYIFFQSILAISFSFFYLMFIYIYIYIYIFIYIDREREGEERVMKTMY